MFVVPNPIDFDKVFTEFTRLSETGNVAVIVAVSCVFGIYLLLLLLARKYDKLDYLKVSDAESVKVRPLYRALIKCYFVSIGKLDISEHTSQTNHSIDWENVCISKQDDHLFSRRIREAFHIIHP